MSADLTTDDLPWRPAAIAALIAFVGGVVLRWWLLRSPFGGLNSDEAVTGLMGYDVLHGHPSLVIGGTTYGSTIEAWLAAPVVAIFGGSRVALKVLNSAEWLAASAVVYWAFRPLLGRARALAVAAILWVQSGAFIVISTLAYLGYGSGLIAGAAAFGFLIRSVDGPNRNRAAMLGGLCAGLAVWGHPLYLVPLIPAAAATLWLRRRDDVVQWLWRGAVGGVVGLSALIAANIRNGGEGLKSPPQTKITTYRERLEIVFAQLTPRALGLRTENGEWLYPRQLGMLASLAFIALSIVGLIVLGRRRRTGLIVAAAGIPAVVFLPAFANTWFYNDGRYFSMITVPLLVGVVCLSLIRVRPAVHGRALACAVVAWGVLSCGPWFRHEVPRRLIDPDAGLSTIVARLDQAGIKGIIGHYWAVYRVSFGSDNRIKAAVQQSLNDGSDRFVRMQRVVESLPPNQVAYVYLGSQDHPDQVPGGGANYTRVEDGGVIIYIPKG
jgi:hypothetical protein